MSEATNPLPPMPRPKDVLEAYRTAEMRSDFYSQKSEAVKNPEKAKAFSSASDEQSDLSAELMNVIIHTRARELADVHAKLVLLKDLFASHFEEPDFIVQDQAKLLKHSIEWIEMFLACQHEKKPVAVEDVTPITPKKAA